MIGQEVNSPAQKLLRSARRKRGALQGVNVINCSHVVPTSSATPHLLFLAAVEYGTAGAASERARRAHCKRDVRLFLFATRKPNPELCLFDVPPGIDHISFAVAGPCMTAQSRSGAWPSGLSDELAEGRFHSSLVRITNCGGYGSGTQLGSLS